MDDGSTCERCWLDWKECTCPPMVPGPTTRDMVGDAPVILIDQREQAPLRFTVPTESVLLPCGDYSLRGLSAEVAIERKSLPDLVMCCGKDRARFVEQIERMRDFRFRALVVESRLSHVSAGIYRSNINAMSVIGTLIKIAHDYGVPVWMAESPTGAAELVERMLLREFKNARKRRAT